MIIIETRIKTTTLAKLVRYYSNHHKIIRSRSSLIRSALDEYASLLDQSEISPTEALTILGELGITNNERTRSGIVKELQEESLSNSFNVGSLLSTLQEGINNDRTEQE